jgi:hypothetical protein
VQLAGESDEVLYHRAGALARTLATYGLESSHFEWAAFADQVAVFASARHSATVGQEARHASARVLSAAHAFATEQSSAEELLDSTAALSAALSVVVEVCGRSLDRVEQVSAPGEQHSSSSSSSDGGRRSSSVEDQSAVVSSAGSSSPSSPSTKAGGVRIQISEVHKSTAEASSAHHESSSDKSPKVRYSPTPRRVGVV